MIINDMEILVNQYDKLVKIVYKENVSLEFNFYTNYL